MEKDVKPCGEMRSV